MASANAVRSPVAHWFSETARADWISAGTAYTQSGTVRLTINARRLKELLALSVRADIMHMGATHLKLWRRWYFAAIWLL